MHRLLPDSGQRMRCNALGLGVGLPARRMSHLYVLQGGLHGVLAEGGWLYCIQHIHAHIVEYADDLSLWHSHRTHCVLLLVLQGGLRKVLARQRVALEGPLMLGASLHTSIVVVHVLLICCASVVLAGWSAGGAGQAACGAGRSTAAGAQRSRGSRQVRAHSLLILICSCKGTIACSWSGQLEAALC
jgi:hypothetical protein